MILALLSLACWLLCIAAIERNIRRPDAAVRASAYLDRVLPDPNQPPSPDQLGPAPWLHGNRLAACPYNPEDVAWLHAAEGAGTYLAEADAVAILMGRATAREEGAT